MSGSRSPIFYFISLVYTLYHCFAVSKLQWDSPLDIVRYPDPRLRAKNAKIAVFDDSLKQLAAEMFQIMYRYNTFQSVN